MGGSWLFYRVIPTIWTWWFQLQDPRIYISSYIRRYLLSMFIHFLIVDTSICMYVYIYICIQYTYKWYLLYLHSYIQVSLLSITHLFCRYKHLSSIWYLPFSAYPMTFFVHLYLHLHRQVGSSQVRPLAPWGRRCGCRPFCRLSVAWKAVVFSGCGEVISEWVLSGYDSHSHGIDDP